MHILPTSPLPHSRFAAEYSEVGLEAKMEVRWAAEDLEEEARAVAALAVVVLAAVVMAVAVTAAVATAVAVVVALAEVDLVVAG